MDKKKGIQKNSKLVVVRFLLLSLEEVSQSKPCEINHLRLVRLKPFSFSMLSSSKPQSRGVVLLKPYIPILQYQGGNNLRFI